MRKLASVQKILSITPIEGADSLELAKILGWNVVVKKGEFKSGDLCVYCEIDSLFPETEDFLFLKPRGMRIKTIRLRGQVSQGIAFPISLVEKYGLLPEDMFEGQDVTSALGITKYEPPIPANLGGEAKGNFPSWGIKTDETRVQVLQHVLDKYKGTICYITEKLDGSSVTYYIKDGEFGVCSRNLEFKETQENTFWKVARELKIEEKLRSLNCNCALQGELIGEGIQKNKYKLKGQTVKFFNLFNIDLFKYADYAGFMATLYDLGLDHVPIIKTDYVLGNNIDELVTLSIDKSVLNKDTQREGIVIRPLVETIDPDNNGYLHADRVSFKAINPEFLIKHGE